MAPQSVIDDFANFLNKLHATARPGSHDSQPRKEAEEAMSKSQHSFGKEDRSAASYSFGGPHPAGPTGKDERGKPLPKPDFEDYWELPSRYISPRVLEMSDLEASLIASGGADEHFL